jgi:hypothetical protein
MSDVVTTAQATDRQREIANPLSNDELDKFYHAVVDREDGTARYYKRLLATIDVLKERLNASRAGLSVHVHGQACLGNTEGPSAEAEQIALWESRVQMICTWAHHARNKRSGLTPARALRWMDDLGAHLFGPFPPDQEFPRD